MNYPHDSKQYRAVSASLEARGGGPLFTHPYVGRKVVYRPALATQGGEEGVVTSVSPSRKSAFVRFGLGATSALCAVANLENLDGTPVVL